LIRLTVYIFNPKKLMDTSLGDFCKIMKSGVVYQNTSTRNNNSLTYYLMYHLFS